MEHLLRQILGILEQEIPPGMGFGKDEPIRNGRIGMKNPLVTKNWERHQENPTVGARKYPGISTGKDPTS